MEEGVAGGGVGFEATPHLIYPTTCDASRGSAKTCTWLYVQPSVRNIGGAGIVAVWQVDLVKQLPIMGSNPSQPHILVEGRRKAEEWRKAMGGKTGFSAP